MPTHDQNYWAKLEQEHAEMLAVLRRIDHEHRATALGEVRSLVTRIDGGT